MEKTTQLVIITGMSGAGKTVAVQSFEDMGYFTMDNMPPALLPKFLDLIENNQELDQLALVVDMRSRTFFQEIVCILDAIEENPAISLEILFLDATDEELVARYKETRRHHPLAVNGRVLEGIALEREMLAPLKNMSQHVIDTTELAPRNLRQQITEAFSTQATKASSFRIEVVSFGFKYGLPLDADLVFDVRFLPNPYYNPELRELTGLDTAVYDYVMRQPESEAFYQHLLDLLEPILPAYQQEGKALLTIAIGCTGGQHRSVAFAKRLSGDLAKHWPVRESHRDEGRRKETVNRS